MSTTFWVDQLVSATYLQPMTDESRKRSIYFPADLLAMVAHEAKRLDRPFSWVVQRCVRIGIKEIKKLGDVREETTHSN